MSLTSIQWGLVGGWGMYAREGVHNTYHSAAGCGASVGVLTFTSLFSHYKRAKHTPSLDFCSNVPSSGLFHEPTTAGV